MKKLFAFLCSLTLLCASVPVLPVTETAVITANAEVKYGIFDNFKYSKSEDYILIDGIIDKSVTEITIPAEIDGLPVTNIGYEAFKYCSNLTSVTIPNSVISINDRAFYYCQSLDTVIFPTSITTINRQAFFGTPWLKAKQEENPLVIINNILIDGSNCKDEITIPTGVTSISNGAFENCSLNTIIIENDVSTIKHGAFSYCNNLHSVIIGNNVTSIESNALWSCNNLISITIKNPNCKIADSFLYNSTFYGTIYGCKDSTAQEYAEKHGNNFALLNSAPAPTTETEVITEIESTIEEITEPPTENTTWNGKNPDLNSDGKIDAKDAALVLVFAAEYGAGNIKNFSEFMDKQYPNG